MSASELIACLFVFLPQLVDFRVLFIKAHIRAYFRLTGVAPCISLPTCINSPLIISRAQGDVLRCGLLHCKNSHSVSHIPPRVVISPLLVLDVSEGKGCQEQIISFIRTVWDVSLQMWSRAGRMKRHTSYAPALRSNALQMAEIQSDPKPAAPDTLN